MELCQACYLCHDRHLQFPEPPSEITIVTPPDGPIIGQPYVPVCNVSIFDSQRDSVAIQWIDPMGVTIVSCTAAGNISLSLNFNQLSATNAGSYTCRAVITSPLFDGQRSIERTLNVRPIRDPGTFDIYRTLLYNLNVYPMGSVDPRC